MPREKTGFDEYKYQQEYIKKNLRFVNVPFNSKLQEEIELYDYLNIHAKETGEKKGAYIKRLIRQEYDDYKAIEENRKRVAKAEEEVGTISFQAVDGWKDEEACKKCLDEDHRILVERINGWEVRIDVDEKKVLTVQEYMPHDIYDNV